VATTAVDRPAAPSVLTQPTFLLLSVVGVLVLAFFYMEAMPYFSLNEATFGPYWWSRRWPLMLHISAGTVALLTGPAQVWLGLTYSKPEWHRRLGVVYIASVAAGSFAAFYLLTYTELGLGFQTGVFGLAVAWVVTTGMAFVAIRRGVIEQHREWMIRSYVVTTGFVMFRIVNDVLLAFNIGGSRSEQRGVAAWLCWAAPLLITEAIIQGRKIRQATQV
jgi:uncharacterized membrane protein